MAEDFDIIAKRLVDDSFYDIVRPVQDEFSEPEVVWLTVGGYSEEKMAAVSSFASSFKMSFVEAFNITIIQTGGLEYLEKQMRRKTETAYKLGRLIRRVEDGEFVVRFRPTDEMVEKYQ